ncbi:MAG: HAD family phosphatase [Oscillospiraceae bacterium]|nr:HAD family phosphatase [Oscillospiraceae bacterium]
MTRFDCVIFDMDGLVIDSEMLSFGLMRDIAREQGSDLSFEEYSPMIGRGMDFFEGYIKELFPSYKGTANFLTDYQKRYKDALAEGKLRLKKGFLELIEAIDARGIKKVLASSNIKKAVDSSLGALNAARFFDAIVYGELVEHTKPAPDIFLKAAELAGTPPERCLVLEDSPPGIRAAHAAGMSAIIVPDTIEPEAEILKLCERRCDSLLDVMDCLD